jgi:peptidoglycan lytic transglycosylase
MKQSASAAFLIAFMMFAGAMGAELRAQTGIASYYKSGLRTANGERFNPHGLTAAHRSLPFGTRVLVRNVRTGRSVVVRINDRGPFVAGRVIDLAFGAAQVIDLHSTGVARVSLEVIN